MSDDLVSRLRQDAEMLQDGPQRNLTKLWHSEVVKDAAKDCQEAATALTEARAEIERLNAQVDEALRSCLAEREGRLKAEAAISTLRARVREVVGPFARADAAIGSTPGSFRFETGTGYRLIEREDLSAARQLMEEVK